MGKALPDLFRASPQMHEAVWGPLALDAYIQQEFQLLTVHTEMAIRIFQYWPSFQTPRGEAEITSDGVARAFHSTAQSGPWRPRYPSHSTWLKWELSHDLVILAVREHIFMRNNHLANLLRLALVSQAWRSLLTDALSPQEDAVLSRHGQICTSILFPLSLPRHASIRGDFALTAVASLIERPFYFNQIDAQLLRMIFHESNDPSGTADVGFSFLCPRIRPMRHPGRTSLAFRQWALQRVTVKPTAPLEHILDLWLLISQAIPQIIQPQMMPPPRLEQNLCKFHISLGTLRRSDDLEAE